MRFLIYPSRIISVFCLFLLLVSVHALAQLNGSTSYNANTVPISGNYNAAFGLFTLYSNTGQANTGIGYASMFSNTSGSSNSATGRSSMFGNTTGNNNTAVGLQSLFTNTTGSSNTVVGYQALYSGTSSRNVALGYRAMYSNNTGGAM